MRRQNTPSVEERESCGFGKWGIYVSSIFLMLIGISYIPSKLSILEVTFILPRISQITDLKQNHSIEVSPHGSLFYTVAILSLLYVVWHEIINRRAEIMKTDITKLQENVKEQKNKGNTDMLIRNCVNMMDQADFECKYLQAVCANNNQTPGVKYGGEVEWALGETSSEDELEGLSKASPRPIEFPS